MTALRWLGGPSAHPDGRCWLRRISRPSFIAMAHGEQTFRLPLGASCSPRYWRDRHRAPPAGVPCGERSLGAPLHTGDARALLVQRQSSRRSAVSGRRTKWLGRRRGRGGPAQARAGGSGHSPRGKKGRQDATSHPARPQVYMPVNVYFCTRVGLSSCRRLRTRRVRARAAAHRHRPHAARPSPLTMAPLGRGVWARAIGV